MEKLSKNGILKSFISTVLFGLFYSLVSLIIDGAVEVDKVLKSMVLYFIIMCVLYFVAKKFRKNDKTR